jgi:MFS superfamily sulfate permease-like transporter
VHVYRIGREQFAVFVGTIVAVLATDLLVGIAIGVGIEWCVQLLNGVPLRSLLPPYSSVRQLDDRTWLICPQRSAVFVNWIMIRRQILAHGLERGMNVVVDLSETHLVDHTVMEKLHDLKREFQEHDLSLDVVGLDRHVAMSPHPTSARLRGVKAAVKDAKLAAH